MPTDSRLYFTLGQIRSFHHDLFAHHDGRGHRQVELEVRVRHVIRFGLGCRFDSNVICIAQTGHHLFKMLSRFAVGFVEKKVHGQHWLSP